MLSNIVQSVVQQNHLLMQEVVSISNKKSKGVIDVLSDLNISINYGRLFTIKSQHSEAALAQINNNDDILSQNLFLEKDLLLIQQMIWINLMVQLSQFIKKKQSMKCQNKPVKLSKSIYDIQYRPKPVHKNNHYSIYKKHRSKEVMRMYSSYDIIWVLVKTLSNNLVKDNVTQSDSNLIIWDKNQPAHIEFYQLFKAFHMISQICILPILPLLNQTKIQAQSENY